jgi:hypothetical protein
MPEIGERQHEPQHPHGVPHTAQEASDRQPLSLAEDEVQLSAPLIEHVTALGAGNPERDDTQHRVGKLRKAGPDFFLAHVRQGISEQPDH